VGDGKGENSGLAPYRGKVGGIMTATPGGYGGVRGLPHLRQILSALGVLVLPQQMQLAHADQAFDAAGQLADPRMRQALERLVKALVDTTSRLA
jgi:chromate reductase, NAD(P)H dehydrogenase (quinone)